jgi:hypothetical protein
MSWPAMSGKLMKRIQLRVQQSGKSICFVTELWEGRHTRRSEFGNVDKVTVKKQQEYAESSLVLNTVL